MRHTPPGGIGATVYYYEVLLDITEDEFRLLKTFQPTMAVSIITSEGTVWRCTVPTCRQKLTSKIAAVLHEADHRGIDPFTGRKQPLQAEQIQKILDDMPDEVVDALVERVKSKLGQPTSVTSATNTPAPPIKPVVAKS